MLATRESLAQRNPPQDATREQEHCDAPDIEDDAHGRRKGRWVVGCAGEGRYSVPRGPAPGQVNSLNAWCKVTVLRLKGCGLGEGGGRALRLNTTVTSLDLFNNSLGEGGGRAIAQTLRLNTTLTSPQTSSTRSRSLGETLRLNTTVASLDIAEKGLGEGGGRALAETLRLNTRLRRSTLAGMAGNRGGSLVLQICFCEVKLHSEAWSSRLCLVMFPLAHEPTH